jgi:hypothetical protein
MSTAAKLLPTYDLPIVEHEPDPVLVDDAHQFIRVELLDHLEECAEEDCSEETRIAVATQDDPSGSPFCKDHAHVQFADWMVGA